MTKPVRVGVVGTGVFGSHHARHYAEKPEAHLVAVVDNDLARAEAAAARHGVVPLADHKALVGRVDAASVTVPASLHHNVAADLIDAGIHLFVEKPLAATAREAADLMRRAERAGVVLQVGHIERFSPAFRALRDRVSAPTAMRFVRHTSWNGRSTDVDVVLDLMIHDIDLALELAGAPVVAVKAEGRSGRSSSNDEVEAELHFASGCRVTLSASRVSSKAMRLASVTAGDREFIADLAGQSLTIRDRGGEETVAIGAVDNLGAEIAAFLASVGGGPQPEVDGRAGLRAVETAEMILAAIKAGQQPERKAS
ncbi:MAG TPA: Gfo/Idh/MocA family oxidoreductase [Bauldia sp.]|nr:Gfo/Idh/MocA family oxidoreductase [Bauldia sp.]